MLFGVSQCTCVTPESWKHQRVDMKQIAVDKLPSPTALRCGMKTGKCVVLGFNPKNGAISQKICIEVNSRARLKVPPTRLLVQWPDEAIKKNQYSALLGRNNNQPLLLYFNTYYWTTQYRIQRCKFKSAVKILSIYSIHVLQWRLTTTNFIWHK